MHLSIMLDRLRILAISLVLAAHAGQLPGYASGDFFGWKNVYFVSPGGVAVTLFWILPGILAGSTDPSRQENYPGHR